MILARRPVYVEFKCPGQLRQSFACARQTAAPAEQRSIKVIPSKPAISAGPTGRRSSDRFEASRSVVRELGGIRAA